MANTKVQSEQIANDAVVTSHIADNVGLGGSPTTTTQSPSDNSTKIATTAYVDAAYAALVDSSPATLNTLNELAAALGDDANFSTTVTNSIATKLPLAGGTLTGDLILGDNVKLEIGSATGGDLQLYHDGTHSYIDNNKGALFIRNNVDDDDNNNIILQAKSGEFSIICDDDGAVTLYHDNAAKLSTTSTGVSSTGYAISNNTALYDDHSTLSAYSDTNGVYLNGKNAGWLSTSADGTQRTYARFFGQSNSGGEYIQFNVADATRMKIDSSGNVGIGTTSPVSRLNLKGTQGNWRVDPDSVSAEIQVLSTTVANDGFRNFRLRSNDTIFENGGTERMRILSTGNVGIGTTSPTAPLHITRTASGYPILKLTQNGADQYNTIYLQNSDSTAATVVMGTGGGSVGNAAWANNAVFGTTSNANVVILQNDAEKLRVNSVADDATLKITQSSETGGQLLIRSNYSDPHYLATQGTNHSSGGWYWGYGVQMSGSGTTKSTFSNFNGSRSFVQLFGDRVQYNFAGAQNTTIGNAVSLTESVRIDAQGIKFNGDTGTANALDDYEEGTWTPTIGGWSNTTVKTAGSQNQGHYTKIGNLITVTANIIWNGTETLSGGVIVRGLPYTAKNQAGYRAAGSIAGFSGLTASGSYTYFTLGIDSNLDYFYIINANASGYGHSPTVSNTGAVYGLTFSYQTH